MFSLPESLHRSYLRKAHANRSGAKSVIFSMERTRDTVETVEVMTLSTFGAATNWRDVKCVTWRGDRDASCTPSGKGQRGVVAVYLIEGKRLVQSALEMDGLLLADQRLIIKMNFVARVFWVEHPYHVFSRAFSKAENDAGGWLGNLRPAVCVQAGKMEAWCLVHQSAILGPQ